MSETLTLQLPEPLYRRLLDTAQAMQRPLEEIVLRVLEIGSPPLWSNAPPEYQTDLASLDKLEDDALWQWVHRRLPIATSQRIEILLESPQPLTPQEQQELLSLQDECDRLMLCKAQAAAILRWRGHGVSLPQPV
ncbi:hypothetical protein VB712_17790 [Spirulina sp. CCNP1310]|uniref:hypothetical protein n=1 Tax=Spirulina sp. CCNP1310 TaxID=3110249 RepID=UPI002B210936|nr:hypothetical protein [Spirulina sp. CCNP1310]MEA5421082.1 hypothetical protein [Spirulina sp. CCNP1310]